MITTTKNKKKITLRMLQEKKLFILQGIFIAALLLGNLLGSKVTTLFGIVTSVGIFAYPITFLITDIVEEVKGKAMAKMFITSGVFALLLSFVLVWLSVSIHPAGFYTHNQEYSIVFGNSLRIIVASLVAFVIAQYHDLWAFEFWKEKTKGRFLWLRNNASTIVSQFIDTTIFTFIAFYAVTPDFTLARIVSMIIPYWFLKVIFALIDTPFVYLGTKWFNVKR